MNIPSYVNTPICDDEGNVSPAWMNIFNQIILQLQTNLSDEGYVLPKATTAQIATLTGTQSIGSMIYDTSSNEFKVNINGTWKVVTVV